MKDKKSSYKYILEHCDRDEIISKLCMDISPREINEWLQSKYETVGEKKLILSERSIKSFKDDYLDFYTYLKQDMQKTKFAMEKNVETIQSLELSVKNNSSYKSKMMELAGKEVDIRKIIITALSAVEAKVERIYDISMENPQYINNKLEYPLIQWFAEMGNWIERYYKMIEQGPDQIIQHNIAVQSVDNQVAIIQNAIREVLSQMDVEASLMFIELVNDKLGKLKEPNNKIETTETRLAQAQIINDDINQRLNTQ